MFGKRLYLTRSIKYSKIICIYKYHSYRKLIASGEMHIVPPFFHFLCVFRKNHTFDYTLCFLAYIW